MNILFLSQFFWPETRTAPMNLAAIAGELAAKGHNITVVTAIPNHPFGQFYDGYSLRVRQWEKVKGVKILRLPLFPDHSLSLFKRALNYISFSVSVSLIGILSLKNEKFDVIFSYLPPLTISIPGVLISRIKRAPIVYWMTDLWPENIVATGTQISPIFYKTIRMLENWTYKNSAIISVNSSGYIEKLIEKGVDKRKLRVLIDWADENLFFPVAFDYRLAQSVGLVDKFNVIYGGNLGKVQGLDIVLDAANLLQDIKKIQFVFIGDGTELERLINKSKVMRLENVKFLHRKPMEEIHKYFGLADVLFVHLEKKPIFRMQIPSKIIAYMACGKPVLCAIEGEAAKIVETAKAGVSCPPDNPQALAKKVRFLYGLPKNELESFGENGRNAFLENYTRSLQVKRVESFFREVCNA